MMENSKQDKNNSKRSWNDNGCSMNLLYVVNQDRKGEKYSFSTEEEDGEYSIGYEKKGGIHYYHLCDYPYYMDEYGNPIFLGLAFLCHKNLEPKLDDVGDYVFTKLEIENIDCEKNLDKTLGEDLTADEEADNKANCWIIEHATSKNNKNENDITTWVGDVKFTLFDENDEKDKTPPQKIVIHIDSQIFKVNDLKKTVLKLRTKLTNNLLSKFNINNIEHTDSVKNLIKSLGNISTILYLLNKAHQKILVPTSVYMPKKNITKITPHTHRQLLK